VTVVQRGGECVVTLPYADAWSVTLYNSVGAAVACRSGEGSEIILPATSKGTHILVVNADGRVVKKKVFIK
ncbi:MAG: T9SS type A sorting domain-containing protein, partial [Bacteroidaceae bacterium]|nr:T9SS type A sorting domain-containing protein [Bacteroidaceae bacterium]